MNDTRFHWVDDFAEPQETKGFMKAVHRREPTTFFVGDLFGGWVSDDLIQRVFDECVTHNQPTYLFLTKNPARYERLARAGKLPPEHWYGTTLTTMIQYAAAQRPFHNNEFNTFLSIEPIRDEILLEDAPRNLPHPKLAIIGAETGNRADKFVPPDDWVLSTRNSFIRYGVPAFMKDSLLPIAGAENMRRQLPRERG